MLEKILIVLFTGLIGLWLGHRLRLGGDDAAKRKRYRSFIELLRQKTEARFVGAFFLEHKNTFPEFDNEALNVRPHIRRKAKFDAACAEYRNVEFSVLDDKRSAAGKAKVLAILNEIWRYAKEWPFSPSKTQQ
jgi:hypothetical protein